MFMTKTNSSRKIVRTTGGRSVPTNPPVDVMGFVTGRIGNFHEAGMQAFVDEKPH